MADSNEAPASNGTMKVSQIFVYPVKSLRGLSPPSYLATYTGFQHDRRFMFQRVSDGANMVIAKETELCLFTTHIPASASSSRDHHTGENDTDSAQGAKEVEIRYALAHTFHDPSQPVDETPLTLPLNPSTAGLNQVKVDMHHSPTTAYDMGPSYNDWFSLRLGYAVRLLYLGANKRLVLGNMPPNIAGLQRDTGSKGEGVSNDYDRVLAVQNGTGATANGASGGSSWLGNLTSTVKSALNPSNKENNNTTTTTANDTANPTKQYDGVDSGLTFADIAPYLVISATSWANAQRRLPASEDLDISKFRPNIVIANAPEEFEEDFWAELEFTNPTTKKRAVLVLTQNCARCNSLNVDYGTGKVGEGEAGRILKKLQGDRRVDGGARWSPVFGRYGFLKRVGGDGDENKSPDQDEEAEGVVISVGDEVRVVRRNSERTRFEWPELSTNS